MPTNFSSLRSASKTALDKLNDEIKKESQKQGADERFWKLSVDAKNKIGFARLRFLPAPKNEDVPWVRKFSHGFKHDGKWLIENCPTTLGQHPCPVCKENNRLWNSGVEADKSIARDRKRKLRFISNVLVVEDAAHPENVGKVFLFEYGAKIHEKIQELVNPSFPDQTASNPFDFWTGSDFKLKSQNVGGFQNYDKSEFDDPSDIGGNDDAKEEIWTREYGLQQFVAEDQFKNYDDLAKRLQAVLTGNSNDGPRTAQEAIKAEAVSELADVRGTREEAEPAKPRRARGGKTAIPAVTTTDELVETVEPDNADDIKKFFEVLT